MRVNASITFFHFREGFLLSKLFTVGFKQFNLTLKVLTFSTFLTSPNINGFFFDGMNFLFIFISTFNLKYTIMSTQLFLQKVNYNQLNPRQKENYNFAKISSLLADYGFSSIRLCDNWQGADFIAIHIDGQTMLKVQLKGRFTLDKKYLEKNIWIAFPEDNNWYLYPHDDAVNHMTANSQFSGTTSWQNNGTYHWPVTPQVAAPILIKL